MLPQAFLVCVRMYAPHLPPPELLSQVAYARDMQLDDSYWNDVNGDFREAVCCEIARQFDTQDRVFLRYLLEQEIASMHVNWSVCENTRRCVGLLAQLRNVEDVFLIWDAKRSTFDSFLSIDAQALVAAGVEKTLGYLRTYIVAHKDQEEDTRSIIDEIELHQYEETDVEDYLLRVRTMWREEDI